MQSIKWFKSSKSGSNGQCVEAAFLDRRIAVRDSKDPHGTVLTFPDDAWARFVAAAKHGEFH